jgi:hypothetical protein
MYAAQRHRLLQRAAVEHRGQQLQQRFTKRCSSRFTVRALWHTAFCVALPAVQVVHCDATSGVTPEGVRSICHAIGRLLVSLFVPATQALLNSL